jgi:hypothetical protein
MRTCILKTFIIIFYKITVFRNLRIRIPDIWNENVITQHICRCNSSFHKHKRYDWIALLNTQIKESDRKADISDYSFGCLQLLFEFGHESDIYHLAYIQHYTRRTERDQETGMWVLDQTKSYEIVPVSSIIRNVHLIPFFDNQRSASDALLEDEITFNTYLLNHHSDRYTFFNFF